MINRRKDTEPIAYEACHGGLGTLLCSSMLKPGDSGYGLTLFHHDVLPVGVSIGQHAHGNDEEIYYLVRGSCTLLYDGESLPMEAGDLSLCGNGHTHGIVNTGDTEAELIVVGVRRP